MSWIGKYSSYNGESIGKHFPNGILLHINIVIVEFFIINENNYQKKLCTHYLWIDGTLSELTSTFSWYRWCSEGSDTADGVVKPIKNWNLYIKNSL